MKNADQRDNSAPFLYFVEDQVRVDVIRAHILSQIVPLPTGTRERSQYVEGRSKVA